MIGCCDHVWEDDYYGIGCALCDTWYPHDGEPWNVPTDAEQARLDEEEYYYTHGTCAVCGGEWGDGWSSCRCDMED